MGFLLIVSPRRRVLMRRLNIPPMPVLRLCVYSVFSTKFCLSLWIYLQSISWHPRLLRLLWQLDC